MPRSGPPRPSDVFAGQLRRYRDKKRPRMTTEALAERMEQLGAPMHPTAITKIEKGDRKVTVDEWLIFAAALNVPPPLLLCALGTEDEVAITSGSVIHPHLAWEWLAGEESLASTDRKSVGGREWYEAAEPLRLFRALRRAQNDASLAYSKLQNAKYVGDEKRLVSARANLAKVFEGLSRLLASMREADVKPPRMPDEYLEEARLMGIDLEGDDDGEH